MGVFGCASVELQLPVSYTMYGHPRLADLRRAVTPLEKELGPAREDFEKDGGIVASCKGVRPATGKLSSLAGHLGRGDDDCVTKVLWKFDLVPVAKKKLMEFSVKSWAPVFPDLTSEEGSMKHLPSSSLDWRFAWKLVFTSADWSLPICNFFFEAPLFFGFGLKWSRSLQHTRWWSALHSTLGITRKYLCLLLTIFHNLNISGATKEVTFYVTEEQREGTFVGSLRKALQLLAPMEFTMLDTSGNFLLDNENGNLYIAANKLDREALCPMDILDQCFVSMDVFISSKEHSEIAKIKVYIRDINDNAPSFTEQIITLSIPEDAAVGTMFPVDHLVIDADSKNNSALTYHLNCTNETFSLLHQSEIIFLIVQKPLDRELQSEYQMDLIASDGGMPSLSSSAVVLVTVTDVNDNCPVFISTDISVTLPRNVSVNSTVAQVTAVDEDIGGNSAIQYIYSNRVKEESKILFQLDSTTGIITLSGSIYDGVSLQHKLTVLAIGPGCIPTVAYVNVNIQELTRQEISVEFRFVASHDEGNIFIKEDVPYNTIIAILDIKDPNNSILRPLYIDGQSPFYLKPAENSHDRYLLLTQCLLDFELEQKYDIHIIGNSTVTNSIVYEETLSIKIVDANDNSPQFSQNVIEIFLEENNRPGVFLLKVSASDSDSGVNGHISYSLDDDAPAGFSIDSTNGILTAGVSFDQEQHPSYIFKVIASDHGSPSHNSSCTIIVNILDQNDNPPMFSINEFTFFIPEDLPQGGEVGIINVTDADIGLNGEFSVYLLNVTTLFSIDQERFILKSEGSLDYERELMYELWIEAKDKGDPQLSSRTKILVFILDVNDNAPLILLPESNYSYILVSPDTSEGSCITKVHAVDYDAGMNGVITYSRFGETDPSASLFMIDESSGNITLKESTSGHHCGLYQLLVKASDHGYPEVLSTIVRVNILLNHSISNRSYLESLIMDRAITNKENQVVLLGPCTQYPPMASISRLLTVPTTLAVVAFTALLCISGALLFLYTRRRNSKKKKRPDVQIPLKLSVDYCAKDWDEINFIKSQNSLKS
ncbi:protocadherin-20-like [Discoglossus pictus]